MRLPISAALLAIMTSAAAAGPVSFSNGWAEQRLSLFSSNDYSFGSRLGLVSEGSVSIAWTRVGDADWNSSGASWSWTVDESVPATDLARKGGDDRNISLYFVFVPQSEAAGLKGKGIRSLLGNKNVRIISMPGVATCARVGDCIALRASRAGGHDRPAQRWYRFS